MTDGYDLTRWALEDEELESLMTGAHPDELGRTGNPVAEFFADARTSRAVRDPRPDDALLQYFETAQGPGEAAAFGASPAMEAGMPPRSPDSPVSNGSAGSSWSDPIPTAGAGASWSDVSPPAGPMRSGPVGTERMGPGPAGTPDLSSARPPSIGDGNGFWTEHLSADADRSAPADPFDRSAPVDPFDRSPSGPAWADAPAPGAGSWSDPGPTRGGSQGGAGGLSLSSSFEANGEAEVSLFDAPADPWGPADEPASPGLLGPSGRRDRPATTGDVEFPVHGGPGGLLASREISAVDGYGGYERPSSYGFGVGNSLARTLRPTPGKMLVGVAALVLVVAAIGVSGVFSSGDGTIENLAVGDGGSGAGASQTLPADEAGTNVDPAPQSPDTVVTPTLPEAEPVESSSTSTTRAPARTTTPTVAQSTTPTVTLPTTTTTIDSTTTTTASTTTTEGETTTTDGATTTTDGATTTTDGATTTTEAPTTTETPTTVEDPPAAEQTP